MTGHDPLAMDREVRKAVGILREFLEAMWKNGKPQKTVRNPPTLK
jgi:hypothetical protein